MKKKKIESIIITTLAFAMVAMSVGFAAYSSKLNIGGTTTVGANKWSVHYLPAEAKMAELISGEINYLGTGIHTGQLIKEVSIDPDELSLSLKANLNTPSNNYDQYGHREGNENGDFVAINIPIINEGSFDAVINNITVYTDSIADDFVMTRLEAYYQESPDSQEASIFRHYVGPKGHNNSNDTDLKVTTLKPAQNGYPRILIDFSLSYETPTGPDCLPQEDVTINTEVKVNAEQA